MRMPHTIIAYPNTINLGYNLQLPTVPRILHILGVNLMYNNNNK